MRIVLDTDPCECPLGDTNTIITLDKHLLTLKQYQGIAIRTAAEAMGARDPKEED